LNHRPTVVLIVFVIGFIFTSFMFPFGSVALACDEQTPQSAAGFTVRGVVDDPLGAAIPSAVLDVLDAGGAPVGSFHSGGDGSFMISIPRSGSYTLVVSEAGFKTVRTTVSVGATNPAALLHLVMPIASLSTTVQVSAESNNDLTATDENRDSSILNAHDLKKLPIFDNDYSSAMGVFLDPNVSGTGGSGLLVDGVEANHATVSASAVQEVRINQDPYSARYYWPGRGQMEIVTKSAADHYHGQLNFMFRDSSINAQNALAPSKPSEQRRIYEGHMTGPIPYAAKSSFLVSFNRAEEDIDAVVSATTGPTSIFSANVSAPTRDTEFSIRAAHQFSDRHSAYVQYSYEDWTGKNQGVGGQTLVAAGYNNEYREDDLTFHVDSIISATLLNQFSFVAERDSNRSTNTSEAPRVSVSGYFTDKSAQADSLGTEINGRLSEMVTWTHGRHLVKFGAGLPHLSRRAFDDNTNALGSYTFGPTLAPDGTLQATALDNYNANRPSGYSQNTGDVHFIYHQQEMGAFVQDQFKFNNWFSITPGVRYDWQNFLAADRLGFAPRISFAWVLNEPTKTIVRGGGGVYYDRFGSGPLLDLQRYETARRRSILISLNPASLPPSGCVPITLCATLSEQPPALVQLAPNARLPYQIQYGVSIERQIGERATGVISGYSVRGLHSFRSVDVNAPTPESNYTQRPNPNFSRIRQMQPEGFFEGSGLDFSFRGRVNKYFTGFGRYTWSHFESNTGGIGWFPQNQMAPHDEWANAGNDRRHRLGMYAMFNSESVLNLSAGIFANSGTPWTVLTGADKYGDNLFNTRPDGMERNTETKPSYVDLDLRWGYDFHITPNKSEDAPKLGFSAGAFNLMNHPNGTAVDPVSTSPTFRDVVADAPPRRIQLGMRFEF